jgi:hypothetical protein
MSWRYKYKSSRSKLRPQDGEGRIADAEANELSLKGGDAGGLVANDVDGDGGVLNEALRQPCYHPDRRPHDAWA